ncbi:hypothetical protein D2L64_20745 [Micromonospora radicis]|uniref:Membrane transport protein MMPL domain-containing protein n=1 Tax=Micromonospora radicis TaxID=1894971 RepID=A0A418MQS3_9ACTN|nr:hypothetical protein D2L64_20745 [Micromonospora radicis]
MLFLLPILLTGILFGLAMEYEVFLVTRMREAYVHGVPARQAVIDGFTHSARVVAAALIMVGVFAGFTFTDDIILKTVGFALAIGVLVDAFLSACSSSPPSCSSSAGGSGGCPAGWTGSCRPWTSKARHSRSGSPQVSGGRWRRLPPLAERGVVEGRRRSHQGTTPSSLTKVPVGPPSGRVASRTGVAAAASTGRPWPPVKSVATRPGQTALTRIPVPASCRA